MSSTPGTICYLLLVPVDQAPAGEPQPRDSLEREAPYFFDLDIESQLLERRELSLEGIDASLTIELFDGVVWLAEARFALPDLLEPQQAARKQRICAALRDELVRELELEAPLVEEYTIVLSRHTGESPDSFVDEHPNSLVRLLRRVDKPLDRTDAAALLSHRTRYSQGDLTVVDWEGALVFAEAGDFDSDVELLKLGNYQLLRYRMLDDQIQAALASLRQRLSDRRRSLFPPLRLNTPEILEQRLSMLLDFDRIDQSLLLIGDWYTARVYRLIVEAFYLESWKGLVRSKLDNLAAIHGTIQDRLTLTWGRMFDLAQLLGWMLLLVGYVVLFILEM